MISLREGWLFVHVPKTGGNSLQSVLVEDSDDHLTVDQYRDGIDEFEVAGQHTDRKHTTLQEYHDRLPAETYRRLFKFAVVRDPWERAISAYFSPISWVTSPDQPTWSDEAFRHMLDTLLPMSVLLSVGGSVDLDLVLRFERLQEDARALFQMLGLGPIELPHRNRGLSGRPWRDYYDRQPELVDLVGRIYREDADYFGYAYPPQLPTRGSRGRRGRTS
jgi:Sulfotransferase family